MSHNYLRDGRAPIPESETTLRKALYREGLSGYRIHWKKVPGRPDIAYPGKKIAIFVNGCYWHRCPYCNPPFPKTHVEFWQNKFDDNVARDKRKIHDLEQMNWHVLVFWECQIRDNLQYCLSLVRSAKENL